MKYLHLSDCGTTVLLGHYQSVALTFRLPSFGHGMFSASWTPLEWSPHTAQVRTAQLLWATSICSPHISRWLKGAVWHAAGWFSLMTMAVTVLWWKLDSPCKLTSLEATSGGGLFWRMPCRARAVRRSWICHTCHLPLSACADVGAGLILYSLRKHRGCLIGSADVISTSTPNENPHKSPAEETRISLCRFLTLLSFNVPLRVGRYDAISHLL